MLGRRAGARASAPTLIHPTFRRKPPTCSSQHQHAATPHERGSRLASQEPHSQAPPPATRDRRDERTALLELLQPSRSKRSWRKALAKQLLVSTTPQQGDGRDGCELCCLGTRAGANGSDGLSMASPSTTSGSASVAASPGAPLLRLRRFQAVVQGVLQHDSPWAQPQARGRLPARPPRPGKGASASHSATPTAAAGRVASQGDASPGIVEAVALPVQTPRRRCARCVRRCARRCARCCARRCARCCARRRARRRRCGRCRGCTRTECEAEHPPQAQP